MMFRLKVMYRFLALIVLALGFSFSANAQVCGYSINTIYLNDGDGNPIENAKVGVFEPEYKSVEHLKGYEGTGWDKERKAYVYRHGLCGHHRNVVLRISAGGFESIEQLIDLPLGRQAFSVKLKREGTNEKAGFEKLSCSEQPSLCVRTLKRER